VESGEWEGNQSSIQIENHQSPINYPLFYLCRVLRKDSAFAWGTLIALMLIWGSSFILIKRGLEHFDAVQVGLLRIVFAWLFLLPWALRRMRGLTRRQWMFLFLVGFVGSGLPSWLFPKAQTGIDSSLAGILNSLTPLFTTLVGILAFSARPKWFNVLGVLIGLGGAVGLMSVSGGHSLEFNFSYAVYILIATFCYAINANIVKYALPDVKPVTITAVAFSLIGLPALGILLGATDFLPRMQAEGMHWEGLGYVAILGVVGTGLALMFYNRLIHLTTPIFASSVTYLIPLVALSWGTLDGELFRASYLIWIMLILIGVALVNRKRPFFRSGIMDQGPKD